MKLTQGQDLKAGYYWHHARDDKTGEFEWEVILYCNVFLEFYWFGSLEAKGINEMEGEVLIQVAFPLCSHKP